VYRVILQNHMLPFANEKICKEWSFQHDNDSKHSPKLIKTFLTEQNVNVIKWPTQSPEPPLNQFSFEFNRICKIMLDINCRVILLSIKQRQ